MQNSNLSSQIFPMIKTDWSLFIEEVKKDSLQMLVAYNNDKRRIKNLERLINKIKEISNLSKDNIEEILNYKELFMYIDNSLESSFDALNFFKEQDNLDNVAVKAIYERIITSAKIIQINSEYSSLRVTIGFNNERIKRLNELIRGSRIDYMLIRELLNKYKFNDNQKKSVLLYPVVMLSIKQNDIKKDSQDSKKQDKQTFYKERFNELVAVYQKKKNNLKDLLVKCFNAREKMNNSEIDTYRSLANNPNDSMEYNFDDETKFKIYTLAFFKVKKDIENYIDGINDLIMESEDLDDELVFFNEMIGEFDDIANILNTLGKSDIKEDDEINNNVFFALDAFNRVLINDLLTEKNINSFKALLQKVDTIDSSRIEGVKTNPMLGVSDEEKILGKNIFMLTTSKMRLAYVMVNRNILIIGGLDSNDKNDRFDRVIRLNVNRNAFVIKNQIALIEKNDIDYIELQNKIVSRILNEKDKII